MARHSVWTLVIHRSGLERPTSLPRESWRSLQTTRLLLRTPRAKGDRDAANNPEELRASREVPILRPRDLRHLRNRARCDSIHAERRVGGLV